MDNEPTAMAQRRQGCRFGPRALEVLEISMMLLTCALLPSLVLAQPEQITLGVEQAGHAVLDGKSGSEFGIDLALDGDRLVVATSDKYHAPAAYVYERGETGWGQTATLAPPNPGGHDGFGLGIAIDGGVVVVGAPFYDVAGVRNAGAAFVFEVEDGKWTCTATLTHGNAAVLDGFGAAVSVDGDRILVGASGTKQGGDDTGSVYMFERSEEEPWRLAATLRLADGRAKDRFGWDAVLDGDTAVISASGRDVHSDADGAAYVFRLNGGEWELEATITEPGGEGYIFPTSLDLDGNRLVAGAASSHAAHVFERTGAQWTPVATLSTPSTQFIDSFGLDVAVSGDTVVVGASQRNLEASRVGMAHVFRRGADGQWSEAAQLKPPRQPEKARFGYAVELDGGVIAVGAFGDDRVYVSRCDALKSAVADQEDLAVPGNE